MYLHIREQSWIAWIEKLLQSGLLPSCLDSGGEQLIIFLLWVRILISISAHRKCNIFGAGNSSSSRYSLALRLSAPRWAERHKIMWRRSGCCSAGRWKSTHCLSLGLSGSCVFIMCCVTVIQTGILGSLVAGCSTLWGTLWLSQLHFIYMAANHNRSYFMALFIYRQLFVVSVWTVCISL